MKRVFCLGNGESRKGVNLDILKQHGKIYGCNALYRDYTPDVLVAVDQGIIHEIYQSGYAHKNVCYFRNWHSHDAKNYNLTVLPGPFLARSNAGVNPGSNRIRVALVEATSICRDATHRIYDQITK